MKFRKRPVTIDAVQLTERTEIVTLEGTMVGLPSDWLISQYQVDTWIDSPLPDPWSWIEGALVPNLPITGVKGERYPCKDDIFRATYERVLDPDSPADLKPGTITDPEAYAAALAAGTIRELA